MLNHCSVKACVFPARRSGQCRYHELFFSFNWSMTDRTLDFLDTHRDAEDPSGWPLLSIANVSDMKPGKRTVLATAELPGLRWMPPQKQRYRLVDSTDVAARWVNSDRINKQEELQ